MRFLIMIYVDEQEENRRGPGFDEAVDLVKLTPGAQDHGVEIRAVG